MDKLTNELIEIKDRIHKELGVCPSIARQEKLYISTSNKHDVEFQILIDFNNERMDIYTSNKLSIAIYNKVKWFRDVDGIIDILGRCFEITDARELSQV